MIDWKLETRNWKLAALAVAQQPLGDTGGGFTYQNLRNLVYGILGYALLLGEIAAVGFIVYYGMRMAISRDNAEAFKNAKFGLIKACIGAAIIFGAYVIINSIRAAVQGIGS